MYHVEHYPDTFAGRVAYCRRQRGLTQERLAELAHVSVQFISTLEQGRTNIRADYVIRLAEALEVSTDFLLLGSVNHRDAAFLVEQIETLSGRQFTHLKNIVLEYLDSHQDP